MTFIVLSLCWLAGIYLGSWGAIPTEVGIAVALVAALMAALWWRCATVRLGLLGSLVLVTAVLRVQASLPAPDPTSVAGFTDYGVVALRGMVEDSPQQGDRTVEVRLATREIRAPASEPWQSVSGSILVRLPLPASYRYGDYLELRGPLESPPSFDAFPYRAYLARHGISAMMRYPRVALHRENRSWTALSPLYDLRTTFSTVLARDLPEPQAALAQGILLGQRAGIPTDLMTAFTRSNTAHVIAISGSNVSLLVGILFLAGCRLIGRRAGSLLAILGVVLYALMVGLSPSVVRASIMGVVFVVGGYLGRPRDATNALALTATAMTLAEPSVIFDLGFQLSFIATAGLVLISPPIAARLALLPGWLGGLLSAAIGAELATFPLIVINFGQISVSGPLANLIVPPLLPPVMLTTAVTALTGLFWAPLGQVAAYAAWLFLSCMIWSVELLGSLPGAALEIGRPGIALALAYYALLAAILLRWVPRTSEFPGRAYAVLQRVPAIPGLLGLATATIIVWAAVFSIPADTLHLSILDIGQGDAILIQTPKHKVLVDGGPSPESITNALGRRLPFWDRKIDLVVLTHPNEDHLMGLIAVVERYEVGKVLESGSTEAGPTHARWRELLATRAIPRVIAIAGQDVELGDGVRVDVLHPSGQGELAKTPNDNSVVLRVSSADLSILLTGDLGPTGAARLLASGQDLRATVLKVPHHGSSTGLNEALLEAIAPDVAIISVGAGNRFGHPASGTLDLLRSHAVAIYRTDLNGTTEVVATSGGYEVRTQR